MSDFSISVIIPTHNRSELLCQAIDSALEQTFKPLEIIVIDDGSTDSTKRTVADKYGSAVRYFYIEHSGKPSVARNFGVSQASGNWLAFLDSDDLWQDNKLKEQYDFYEAIPNGRKKKIGLIDCFNRVVEIKENNIVENLSKVKKGNHFDNILTTNYVNQTSSVIIRKSVALEFGMFNISLVFGEDNDLWFKVARKYDIYTVQKYLVTHRIHTDNLTHDYEGHFRSVTAFENELTRYWRSEKGVNLKKIFSFRRAYILQRMYASGRYKEFLDFFSESFFRYPMTLFRSRKIPIFLVHSWIIYVKGRVGF